MSAEVIQLPAAVPNAVPAVRGIRDEGGLGHWLWSFIRPELPAYAAVLLLSFLAVAAGLAQPYLTKTLIDEGILAHDRVVIMDTGGWMVALAFGALFIGFTCRRIHVAASARLLHRLRESLFAHLLTLSPAVFSRTRQGDLLARLEGDLGEVQRFCIDAALSAINSVLTLIGTVTLLGLWSPRLALFLAALLTVNTLVLGWVRPRIESLSIRAREAGVEVSSFLVEKLAAVRCIQTHVAEMREGERLRGLHDAVRKRMLALQLVGYIGGAFPNLVLSLAVIGIFVGGGLAMTGVDALSLGTLVAFASCVQRASAPVHTLMGLYLQWQRVKVGLARVGELYALCPALPISQFGREKGCPEGDIVAEDLAFTYPDSDREAVSGLSFTIAAGSKVWLRGDSGSGKSTFIDLLHRHFAPTRGSLRLGGVEVRDLDPSVLRRQVVVVSQEAVLFAGSLADNIRYGRPEAHPAAVEQAARAAGVFEFATHLPNGLDTSVGPRGATLSGGERQRVALARALLMAPSVLVVDEATSSLDGALEQRTLQAINALLPRATQIVVSHRALDAAAFDQVIDIARRTAS